MSSALTKPQIDDLARSLTEMLAKIESGDLDASVGMRHRIEGAIAALDAVQGRIEGLGVRLSEE